VIYSPTQCNYSSLYRTPAAQFSSLTVFAPTVCLSTLRIISPRNAEEHAFMQSIDYGGAIGPLQYPLCTTHPDIAYTVSQLASFTLDPSVAHWHAIKHLF